MHESRYCIALSFDSAFFDHGKECIRSIKRYCNHPADIVVLALRLKADELAWLNSQGLTVREDYKTLPGSNELPLYAFSQICRPFLPDLFPGHAVYMWVDADIRFVHEDAFDHYFRAAQFDDHPLAICQESDGAYINVWSPEHSWGYHTGKNERLKAIYNDDVCRQMRYFYNFNTGIWAAHRDAFFWGFFKDELLCGLKHGFSHLREQDAMNVALLKSKSQPEILPATMNWLCALSVPEQDPKTGRFVRPVYPHDPISVLHLIGSKSFVEVDGRRMNWHDLYRQLKFTD